MPYRTPVPPLPEPEPGGGPPVDPFLFIGIVGLVIASALRYSEGDIAGTIAASAALTVVIGLELARWSER